MSKTLRFEIFKRDGFLCRYCGQRPPDVVLEIDHINPVAAGGDNDPMNLLTSCFDCNRGKKARVLSDVQPRPDADVAYLELQQEIAEAQRYLKAKESRDSMFRQVYEALMGVWSDAISADEWPKESVVKAWLAAYPPENVEAAIVATSSKHRSGQLRYFSDTIRYVWGVLRNRDQESRPREIVDPKYAALAEVTKQVSLLGLSAQELLDTAAEIESNRAAFAYVARKMWLGSAVTHQCDEVRAQDVARASQWKCSTCGGHFGEVAHEHMTNHARHIQCETCKFLLFDVLNNRDSDLHRWDKLENDADGDRTRVLCVDCRARQYDETDGDEEGE